ncbi:PAS domain-containing protein [Kiloniella laminariae]|uniref:PAS domain-containing protein n=1 Tax=Kiloniella laminariae TaxID=454162 RepID=A0ABT4LFK7_9PROT|nr:PAS domain-containing protein [Kiloniella laminariae]MCZ4279720.1 PAS domain-containing protein [Kiloniella laminariae]
MDFRHPNSQSFFEYWSSLPREGVLPLRSSFLPEKIPRLLPTLSIYELVSEDFIKFRLVGSTIRERVVENYTGKNYLDYVAPERRAKASASLWAPMKQPCGMRVFSNYNLSTGRTIFLEVVVLPVLNDLGENPVILLQSNEIKPRDNRSPDEEENLKVITVAGRDFIDIGAGLSDFKD